MSQKKQQNKSFLIGVNLGDYGSTGRIMRSSIEYISKENNTDYLICVPVNQGNNNTFAFGKKENLFVKIFNKLLKCIHHNVDGRFYFSFTIRLINKFKQLNKHYSNIVVILHNLHSSGIDYKLFFKYLSKKNYSIFIVLHDSWFFTGGCCCFNYNKCFEWKKGCLECRYLNTLSKYSNKIFKSKQKAIYSLNIQKIICVSEWVKKQALSSFLNKYETVLIYAATSINIKNTNSISIKKSLNIDASAKVIMFASTYWNEWKGTKYIYEIAKKVPKNYILLVVGGSFDINGYDNIIHCPSVNHNDMYDYYSASDCYCSVSQDETLGLTTCEAQMCGIPVVCFGHGGVKETVAKTSGYVLGEDNSVLEFVNKIINTVNNHPFSVEDIIKNGKRFEMKLSNQKYNDIIRWYL